MQYVTGQWSLGVVPIIGPPIFIIQGNNGTIWGEFLDTNNKRNEILPRFSII